MSPEITDALAKAKTLLDAVSFDDSGTMVAGHYVGGNGGLLSRDTIRAADQLRRALDQLKTSQSADQPQ